MSRPTARALMVSALLALASFPTAAGAQNHDVPPPSPYALPVPGVGIDPEDDPAYAPGRRRNNLFEGNFVKGLIDDGFVVPSGPPLTRRQLHDCPDQPERCGR